MKLVLGFTILMLFSSCAKDILPEEVGLGEHFILVNGKELKQFENSFRYRALEGLTGYSFIRMHSDNTESIYFGIAPLEVGIYDISWPESVISPYDYNITGAYNNIYDYDHMGDPYDLDDPETAYFEITDLDTIQQIVKGKFDVRFKRRDRSGAGSERGKKLHFEGIFHDFYTVE